MPRFHATKQDERFTLSKLARRTVLDHPLVPNHQRYAEVPAEPHDMKPKKTTPSADGTTVVKRRGRTDRSATTEQPELF